MARDERDRRDIEEPRDPRDARRLVDPTDPRDERVVPVDPRDERAPGDNRDERLPWDPPDGSARPVPLIALVTAYFLIGLGLLFQPSRFENTPSYEELLRIFPQYTWSVLYLLAAVVMGAALAWPRMRVLAVAAVTYNIALTGAWLLAFVVRWISDPGTTVVNICSWGVYLTILVYFASRLVLPADDTRPGPVRAG